MLSKCVILYRSPHRDIFMSCKPNYRLWELVLWSLKASARTELSVCMVQNPWSLADGLNFSQSSQWVRYWKGWYLGDDHVLLWMLLLEVFFSWIPGTPTVTGVLWVLIALKITHIHEIQTNPFCFLVASYSRQWPCLICYSSYIGLLGISDSFLCRKLSISMNAIF